MASFAARGRALAALAPKAKQWITINKRCKFFEGFSSARKEASFIFAKVGSPSIVVVTHKMIFYKLLLQPIMPD